MPSDVLVLEPNKKGRDILIGDIHGRIETLDVVLEGLTADDRLFFVGDLIDKGPKSKEVVLKMVAASANPNGPKIYVTRGNHEQECMKAIKAITNIVLANPNHSNIISLIKDERLTNEHLTFLDIPEVGGSWIIDLILKEIESNKISFEEGTMCASDDSEVGMIVDYINDLPIITHVKAGNEVEAFHVVHADMPVSDDELQNIIAGKRKLTEVEIEYALNARPEYYVETINNGRTAASIRAFCGHTIVMPGCPYKPVRPDNTYNLDFGSFLFKHCVVADATNKQIFYYTPRKDGAMDVFIEKMATFMMKELNPTAEQAVLMNSPVKPKTAAKKEGKEGDKQVNKGLLRKIDNEVEVPVPVVTPVNSASTSTTTEPAKQPLVDPNSNLFKSDRVLRPRKKRGPDVENTRPKRRK